MRRSQWKLALLVPVAILASARLADAVLPVHSLSIPAAAFQPADDAAKFRYGPELINRGRSMVYVAPVYLPEGSVILGIEMDGLDRWREGSLGLQLMTIDSSGYAVVLADLKVPPEWEAGQNTWSMPVSLHPVSGRRSYLLYLSMPGVNAPDPSVVSFSGARVLYSAPDGRDVVTREQ